MFIKRIRALLILTVCNLFAVSVAQSSGFNLPYSGRFVEDDGRPVEGPVDLVIRFYPSESATAHSAGPYAYSGIQLIDGVFQVNINLDAGQFNEVFPSVDSEIWIEITDASNGVTYGKQQLASTPFALKVPVDNKSIGWNDLGQLQVKDSNQVDGQSFDLSDAKEGQVIRWDAGKKMWRAQDAISGSQITTGDLGEAAVTAAKVQDGAIIGTKIAPGSVGFSHLDQPCSSGEVQVVNGDADGFVCATIASGGGDILSAGNTVSGPLAIGTNNEHSFQLKSNNKVGIAIDPKGQVGIGDVSLPKAALHIGGKASVNITGTLSLSSGSPTIAGTGTDFSQLVKAGDSIAVAGVTYEVLSIVDPQTLTVAPTPTVTLNGVTGQLVTPIQKIDAADGSHVLVVDHTGAANFSKSASFESELLAEDGIKLSDNDGDGRHTLRLKHPIISLPTLPIPCRLIPSLVIYLLPTVLEI